MLLGERDECVQSDRTVNAEGSHLALKTVCSALFMLLCIDDTVSPAVGRRVFFFFPSAILTRSSSGEGGVKVMVRRNHFVVASSIFSVLLCPASADSSLLSANILH